MTLINIYDILSLRDIFQLTHAINDDLIYILFKMENGVVDAICGAEDIESISWLIPQSDVTQEDDADGELVLFRFFIIDPSELPTEEKVREFFDDPTVFLVADANTALDEFTECANINEARNLIEKTFKNAGGELVDILNFLVLVGEELEVPKDLVETVRSNSDGGVADFGYRKTYGF